MKSTLLPLALLALALTGFGCSERRTPPEALINADASLPGGLPSDPLRWRVIDTFLDRQESTMSTLFGNDAAVDHARTGQRVSYPAGSALALVTWQQQEDPHWFGAKIPGRLMSIEWVTVSEAPDAVPSLAYERYEGTPLRKVSAIGPDTLKARLRFILSQRAAAMPDGAPPITTI